MTEDECRNITPEEIAAWRAVPRFEDDFPVRSHILPKDAINPSHYSEGFSNGAEVIDITENLSFNRGNAVKYLARAGEKVLPHQTRREALIQDLEKAIWYASRELERVRKGGE